MLIRGAVLLAAACSIAAGEEWISLFDGKSLDGWKETEFSGRGKVTVEQGAIVLGIGATGPMTGVTLEKGVPQGSYEVRFEARRVEGSDFFASLTFPVGASYCTLVTGGWGGDIVGLSSIDGWDASENETRTYFDFEKGQWYRFRVRVSAERLTAWINDQQIADVAIGGRTVNLRRGEIKLSAPFGFASYGTRGEVRKIEWRRLRK